MPCFGGAFFFLVILTYLMYMGLEFRRIRLANHVSQAVFAAILGIGKTTVQQWERGRKDRAARRNGCSILLIVRAWRRWLTQGYRGVKGLGVSRCQFTGQWVVDFAQNQAPLLLLQLKHRYKAREAGFCSLPQTLPTS